MTSNAPYQGPTTHVAPEPDWQQIDTVLLDMDGTLLDLHFDNHFWQTHVPRRYAEIHGYSLEDACNRILPHMREIRGTLDWYSIHYWSEYLALDIPALKQEVAHLIRLRPGVIPFLQRLRGAGKRVILATNAHPDTVEIKFSRVSLGRYFDHVVCSHDLGAPKENPAFWNGLQKKLPFDPCVTLLVDDNESVLDAAAEYGIRWLWSVQQPDLKAPAQPPGMYPAVGRFDWLNGGN